MAAPLVQLERLGDMLAQPAPSRRMLIIVNPYATTVSDRLKNLVVYALRGRYEVDAIDTDSRDHATELLLLMADDWRPGGWISARSTAGASCSRPAPGSTPALSSRSTPTRT